MKKIISTLALATLAFGSAFADVKFTLNYRTQAVAFSRVIQADGADGSKASAAAGVLHKTYMFSQTAYGASSDTFSMSASNDFGGVTVRVDPKASDDTWTFNTYSGYVKLGAAKLSAGYWKDGVMNGAYQLKNDADASNLGGETFAAYKLGSMYKGAITQNVDDITGFAGTTAPAAYITYKGEVGDNVELTADLSAVSTEAGIGTWDGSDIYSGIALRLDAKLETWDFQFVVKQADIRKGSATRAIAFHAQPLAWGSIKATFGGALGYYEGELQEYNADIRFRYANGPLSITSLNNISHMTRSGFSTSTDYVKHVGAYFLANDGKWTGQTNINKCSPSAMWNVVALRYTLSEKLAVTAELGDIIGFTAGGLHLKDYGIEAFVAPGVQVFAGKNCSISTCLRFGMNNLFLETRDNKEGHNFYKNSNGDNVAPAMAIAIPVVLRVKL